MELDSIRSSAIAERHQMAAMQSSASADDGSIASIIGRLEKMDMMLQTLCTDAAERGHQAAAFLTRGGEPVADSLGCECVSTDAERSDYRDRLRQQAATSAGACPDSPGKQERGPGWEPANARYRYKLRAKGPTAARPNISAKRRFATTGLDVTAVAQQVYQKESLSASALTAGCIPDSSNPTQREWQLAILGQQRGHAAIREQNGRSESGNRISGTGQPKEWAKKRVSGLLPNWMDANTVETKAGANVGGVCSPPSAKTAPTKSSLLQMGQLAQVFPLPSLASFRLAVGLLASYGIPFEDFIRGTSSFSLSIRPVSVYVLFRTMSPH